MIIVLFILMTFLFLKIHRKKIISDSEFRMIKKKPNTIFTKIIRVVFLSLRHKEDSMSIKTNQIIEKQWWFFLCGKTIRIRDFLFFKPTCIMCVIDSVYNIQWTWYNWVYSKILIRLLVVTFLFYMLYINWIGLFLIPHIQSCAICLIFILF